MAERWRRAWAGGCAVFALSGTALSQGRTPTGIDAPAPATETVAPNSRRIRVGDVILAPAVAPTERTRIADALARKRTKRSWYGQPILVSDALAYGFIGLSAEYEQVMSITLPIGIGTYVLLPPLVHLGVGNWAQALVSGGLRLGLPLTGAVVGAATSDCSGNSGSCGQGVLGFTVAGMLAATLFDAAFLSYERAPQQKAVRPSLAIGRAHAVVGASGEF